ncbi:MAG TPA: hypothetical protein VKV38_17300 [Trebonia sp.]|jgi:hypothetical protein|nr:hypothetical protein [Trebonia sp.]
MVAIRRWVTRRRKVLWEEPALPKFVKINPASPPGSAEGLQPGDLSMALAIEEFLQTEENEGGETV